MIFWKISRMGVLFKLFLSFLKVGSFSFGGAYSLLPLIENEVVAHHGWLTKEEFIKVLGMVEIFPGAISIKYASYTGYKIAGIPGIIAANFGNMFVPVALITAAFSFYNKFEHNIYVKKVFEGIKFIIIGMIIAIMFKYFSELSTSWKSIVMVLLGIGLTVLFKLNPAIIVIIGGIISLVLF